MTLTVGRILNDRAALESLIELAVAALRACRGGGPGIEVVFAAVEIKRGSDCPVCGNKIDRGFGCPACGTPHHEDCWKYLGGCAIFGCDGRGRVAA